MKNNIKSSMKKIIIPTIALSLMFMVPAKAVESTTTTAAAGQQMIQQQTLPTDMAFQIPVNNYCSIGDPLDFSFQLSNAGDTPADITLYLYQQDGTEFNEEGPAYREIGSTLVPGKRVSLPAHATGVYHNNFGNYKKCNERVYLGRIVVHSGQASLLASGWIHTNEEKENVTVNDNKKFTLAAALPKSESVTP